MELNFYHYLHIIIRTEYSNKVLPRRGYFIWSGFTPGHKIFSIHSSFESFIILILVSVYHYDVIKKERKTIEMQRQNFNFINALSTISII